MSQFTVSATSLNFRSEPKVRSGNVLAVLAQGKPVKKLSEGGPAPWWKVEAVIGGTAVQGYVNSNYLTPGDGPEPVAASGLKAVHMGASTTAKRSSAGGRAFPLNEANMPRRTAMDPSQMTAIIDWLDVERGLRWKPGGGKTFCNIYVYDVAYLAGVYVPRVWWEAEAIAILRSGGSVPVQYGSTVFEMNANAITNWFETYGPSFGWRFTTDLDVLQQAANDGKVCVICAQNTDGNRSGHMVVVAPEHGTRKAHRVNGKVKGPLQSQAGASNHRYWPNSRAWWKESRFRKFGFWIHE